MGARRARLVCVVASLCTAAGGASVYPRTSFQQRLHLPLAGTSVAGDYNLMFLAEEGHDLARVNSGICAGVASSFNATEYMPRCHADVAALARAARGLRLQHAEEYAAIATVLQEKLGNDGHTEKDFGATMYNRPFRARFISRLLRGLGETPATVCETGFGAGHSALLFLTELPAARVHTFDHGLAKHTIPAHDFLDDRYPDRLMLYLGDSVITVPQMRDYYPELRCNVIHVDGSPTRVTVRADLLHFAPYAAPGPVISGSGNVVVLQGAHAGSEALEAWRELVEAGVIAWEGEVLESPGSPATSEAIVYGRYTGAAQ